MALGGGTFVSQSKVLPGSYINFVNASRASSTITDRGIAAMPLVLDWGIDGEVFKVDAGDFQKNSLKVFGYPYTHEKLKGLRDLFLNIRTGYFYKLNSSGTKASCEYATAKYSGVRGNDLKIVITKNIDDETKFDVATYLETTKVDSQTVSSASDLKPNDFVEFNKNASLTQTAGTPLSGGTNGDELTGEEYQAFLDKIEPYSFNALGCPFTSPEVANLFIQFTKRMREEVGVKFQTVVYRTDADYEGAVNLFNEVTDDVNSAALVYWVTGITAGCPINQSNTNKLYNGEYAVNADLKQSELEAGIKAGKFMLHKVGDEVRVLEDINSFVSVTDEKNSDFSSNQTIRVLDQIANDIANLFNTKYLGKISNDAAGRISLWNDIVKHHQELQNIRAIEDFSSEDVTVEQGDSKKAVIVTDKITPTSAMAQLYMTVIVQ